MNLGDLLRKYLLVERDTSTAVEELSKLPGQVELWPDDLKETLESKKAELLRDCSIEESEAREIAERDIPLPRQRHSQSKDVATTSAENVIPSFSLMVPPRPPKLSDHQLSCRLLHQE